MEEPLMRRRVFAFAVVCALALGLATWVATAQPTEQAMSPEEQEMMKKWEAFMTPGEPHKHLAQRAGKWTTQVRSWMAPGAPSEDWTGSSTVETIMGGRYSVERAEGSFMGQPFQGMGITGYDNMKQKFVASWIDNMGTGIMLMEGTCDAGMTQCTYTGEGPDVMTGRYKTYRAVTKKINDDRYVFEMYDRGPDGKEWKNFEIAYTRAR
jgi:hypothetical protein